jgi:DNA polymerase-3 subunit alpha
MMTKKGTRMALLTLDDRSGRLEAMLFSEAFERFQAFLEKDRILVVEGEVSFDDFSGGLRMTVRDLMDISEAREKYAKSLLLKVKQAQLVGAGKNRLQQILQQHWQGVCPVNLHYVRDEAEAKLSLGTQWRVTPSDQLLYELRELLGEDQVELEF